MICILSIYIPRFVLAQVYYIIFFFLLASVLIFSVLAKRLAGKNISDMTYLVSSGIFNVNSIN